MLMQVAVSVYCNTEYIAIKQVGSITVRIKHVIAATAIVMQGTSIFCDHTLSQDCLTVHTGCTANVLRYTSKPCVYGPDCVPHLHTCLLYMCSFLHMRWPVDTLLVTPSSILQGRVPAEGEGLPHIQKAGCPLRQCTGSERCLFV